MTAADAAPIPDDRAGPCHDLAVLSDRTVVAAFDVDGTLTVRDCVVPFLIRAAGRSRLVAGVARHPVSALGSLARRDRDALKVLGVDAAVAGRRIAALDRLGEELAAEIEAGWLRPDTLGRLRWHQEVGHRVVLVSASLRCYLEPLGRRLGVDGVLCTQLDVGPDGRCTGQLDGPNCRGPEKAHRLHRWLHEQGLGDALVWAYGDSAGDHDLLAMADRAVWAKRVTIAPVPEGEPV